MNHYTVLRVARTATLADIKAAYRRLALTYHPDRTGGNEEKSRLFVEITAAYNVLIDPIQRAAYDQVLRPEREVDPPRTIPRPRQVWVDGQQPRAKPVDPRHFNTDVWNYHHYGDPLPEKVKLKNPQAEGKADVTRTNVQRVVMTDKDINQFVHESKSKNKDESQQKCVIQ